MIAWGKVTLFLFLHLFCSSCWFTFRMDKNGNIFLLIVSPALHSIRPRLPVFLSALCPSGFLQFLERCMY